MPVFYGAEEKSNVKHKEGKKSTAIVYLTEVEEVGNERATHRNMYDGV